MSEQSPFGKIIGINLVVLLGYAVAIKVYAAYGGGGEDEMVFVFMLATVIGVHVVLALIAALGLGLAGKRDAALAFLASAPLVLLVGFGVCFGGAAIRTR